MTRTGIKLYTLRREFHEQTKQKINPTITQPIADDILADMIRNSGIINSFKINEVIPARGRRKQTQFEMNFKL